jgi:hypothetical protein
MRYLTTESGMGYMGITHALAAPDSTHTACGDPVTDAFCGQDAPTRLWPECQACRDALGLMTATERAFAAGRAAAMAGEPREANPYPDHRNWQNKVTFSRVWRNWWDRGHRSITS